MKNKKIFKCEDKQVVYIGLLKRKL